LDRHCLPPEFPFDGIGPLQDILLDPAGVVELEGDEDVMLRLCNPCSRSLQKNKLPRFALANHMFIGLVPEALKDLTPIKESMVALCQAKCWIVQLKRIDDPDDIVAPNLQRGLRGHVIIYPQQPEQIATKLPPSIEDVATTVCVLFIGSLRPTQEWLEKHAKLLAVRADRVRRALVWLIDIAW
jgi:hypothetical protein